MRGAYAVRRRVSNTYLVRERDRRLRKELLVMLVAILAVASGLLLVIWAQAEVLEIGYRIDGMEKELHELEQRELIYRLEVAHLASPGRVRQRAIEELGMVEATVEQRIFVEELE